jgi:uncharacterized protein (DUF2461 family)
MKISMDFHKNQEWFLHKIGTYIGISVLPRQYLVPELSHMGFNIAAELWYEVLPRKHRYNKNNKIGI